ncbi:MAG: hypothetical protein H6668_22835 [Ardenticatenaceae bacterium]|nr:hypothetical protein [Ardenticatenaceae bacterium]
MMSRSAWLLLSCQVDWRTGSMLAGFYRKPTSKQRDVVAGEGDGEETAVFTVPVSCCGWLGLGDVETEWGRR